MSATGSKRRPVADQKNEPTEKTALLSDTDDKREKEDKEEKDASLASGPVINIYDPVNMGYLMQYYAVGLIYGGLPATVYGFFVGYLNVRRLSNRILATNCSHRPQHAPRLLAGARVRVRDVGRDHDDAVVLQILVRRDQRLLPHLWIQVRPPATSPSARLRARLLPSSRRSGPPSASTAPEK